MNIEPSDLEAVLGDTAISQEELGALAESLGQRFDNVLRLRPTVDQADIGLPLEPIDWYSLGYRNRDSHQRPSMQLPFALGDYYVQDAGSLLALAAAQIDVDETLRSAVVCDLCAAPGGKASAVAEILGEGGFLLANEPIRARVPPLLHNLARTGSDRYAISSLDPEKLAKKIPGVFDIVLVDAPCSGQALVGRGRQSEAAFSQKQIEHSAARQRRILSAAKQLLRPGGRIIYSTCTFAAAENEDQVQWMIDLLGFTPAPTERLARYASTRSPASYRVWPHRHHCAGSFAASLTLESEAISENPASAPAKLRPVKGIKPEADLSQWYEIQQNGGRYFGSSMNLYWLPEDAPEWVESVAITGAEIAYRTGKVWKPAHAAALRRTGGIKAARQIEADEEIARIYLSGATFPNRDRGWSVIKHRGRPLGWIKGDGRIGKNHLPKASRWP